MAKVLPSQSGNFSGLGSMITTLPDTTMEELKHERDYLIGLMQFTEEPSDIKSLNESIQCINARIEEVEANRLKEQVITEFTTKGKTQDGSMPPEYTEDPITAIQFPGGTQVMIQTDLDIISQSAAGENWRYDTPQAAYNAIKSVSATNTVVISMRQQPNEPVISQYTVYATKFIDPMGGVSFANKFYLVIQVNGKTYVQTRNFNTVGQSYRIHPVTETLN